jgi:predicted nucleic acid-binding protein
MRLFLDANVLFSGSNLGSNIHWLLQEVRQGHELLTSDFAIEEARRNILLKRPAWLTAFEDLVTQVRIVPSVHFAIQDDLAEKDAPLLCAAIRFGCQYFVTGDKRDFGHLYGTTIEGVEIVSVARVAELLHI